MAPPIMSQHPRSHLTHKNADTSGTNVTFPLCLWDPELVSGQAAVSPSLQVHTAQQKNVLRRCHAHVRSQREAVMSRRRSVSWCHHTSSRCDPQVM